MGLVLAHRILMALLLAGSCIGRPSQSEATVDGITAIYNFGDSISDIGNFIRQGGTSTGLLEYTRNFPYGITIGRPTGRCSDGYLMIDFLAMDLGLPLLNPYLDKTADFTHGVNFAVAGATALNTATLLERGIQSSYLQTNSSLDVQLGWFKEFMSSTTSSPQEIREKLASSVVLVGEIGGNDYNYAFLQSSTSGGYDLISNLTVSAESAAYALQFIPPVVRSIADAAREVLEMGALRVVIAGNFALGCMPGVLDAARRPAAYDAGGCLAGVNLFKLLHNAGLRRAAAELRRAFPRATVAYADYFAAHERILRGARAFGFDEAARLTACCRAAGGAYNFDLARTCGANGTTVCASPGRRVNWDGIHLTQHAYGVMNELLYRGGLACPPPIRFPGQKDCL